MKNTLKGIFAFALCQVLIILAIYAFIGNVPHPFSAFYNTNDATIYLFLCSLLFLPLYFLLGLFSAKLFKIHSTKKSLILIALIWAIALSAMWLTFVVFSNADHSFVLAYALLNPAAGWAYMIISNIKGYLNVANLLFTTLSPLSFVFGVYVFNRAKK